MEYVFRALDGKAAYWDYHPWTETASQAAATEKVISQMQQLFLTWNPSTTMRCAIFEENGNTHDMARALAHAVMLNVVRRTDGFVPLDSPANALQPWQQNDNGWDQGQIFFDASHTWMQPPYYAQQMASAHHQPLLVHAEVTGTSLDVTVTGTNTVSEGTLCLNNSKATKPMLGTGALTVKSGAALTGAGSLNNAVTISSGGLLRPGVKETSVSGTLDFGAQRVAVARGATLQFFISSQSLYTRLTGIADFVMNGHLVIVVREGISGLTVGREFQLWTAEASDVNPESLSLGALPEGLYWDITDLASSGILRITDDPELSVHPATVSPVVLRTEYFDIHGRLVSHPAEGLYIVRRHLSDGTVEVKKVEI